MRRTSGVTLLIASVTLFFMCSISRTQISSVYPKHWLLHCPIDKIERGKGHLLLLSVVVKPSTHHDLFNFGEIYHAKISNNLHILWGGGGAAYCWKMKFTFLICGNAYSYSMSISKPFVCIFLNKTLYEL